MAITIGAIRNMLDMARGQEALERQDAQANALSQLLERLSDNAYGVKAIKLPDDNDSPITFG
ncbi:hypothetical protein HX792_29575 [Pseudomonas sp. B6002]|uniref:hypothetical protein n=1 Tax=Pseudomonas sp. B6002 TaxID=2726978 RepID=UPI00159F89C2|nr:hypothetical protein [Pseudomonas sp. B6002]NVZ54509.1 hypothetical protein [Pseudomonas sp. B6002]